MKIKISTDVDNFDRKLITRLEETCRTLERRHVFEKNKSTEKFNSFHLYSSWFGLMSPPPYPNDSNMADFVNYELLKNKQKRTGIKTAVKPKPQKAPEWLENFAEKFILPIFLETYIPLIHTAKILGLKNKNNRENLRYHSLQLLKWDTQSAPLFFFSFTYFMSLIMFFAIFFVGGSLLTVNYYLNTHPNFFMAVRYVVFNIIPSVLLLIFFFLLAVAIPTRLLSKHWNRNFIHSLCVREIVFILWDLNGKNILLNVSKKKILQYRIYTLARLVTQIPGLQPSRSIETRKELVLHYSNLARHILNFEYDLIAPNKNTLESLRKEFNLLFQMSVFGYYGDFNCTGSPVESPKTFGSKLANAIRNIGKVIGFILPLVLVGVYLSYPQVFSQILIGNQTFGLLFVSWVLLGIDSLFHLGIVRDLIGLTKGIKELSS